MPTSVLAICLPRASSLRSVALSLLVSAFSCASAQTLNENFDDGAANNWTVVSGVQAWTIPAGTDRVYANTDYSDASTAQISTYTGATWTTNFTLRARVKLWGSGTGNRVGLVYNYQPGSPAKYYAIALHKATGAQKLQFIENTTGATNPTAVQEHAFTLPSTTAPDNNWVDLKITRAGNETTVTVSSSLGADTFTRTQTTISGAGRIGVFDRSADSAFNNVTVNMIFTPGITESPEDPILSPAYTASAITHYVDFVAGSEGNNGTSSATPWKYAPGMTGSSNSAPAGSIIALKRGSVWRLSTGWSIPTVSPVPTAGSPIIYTAYGTGPLPKITVLEDLSSGWTAATGSYNTHVYQRTLPAAMTIERLYIDDEGLGEALSATPAAQDWVGQPRWVTTAFVPSPNPNGVVLGQTNNTGIIKYWRQNGTVLYLYSPAGNPGSLGKRIEGLKGSVAFAIRATNKSHLKFDRLEVHGGATAVVYLEANTDKTATNVHVTNCVVRAAKAKGIFVDGVTTGLTGFSNGVIKWNRVDSGDGPSTPASPNSVDWAGHPNSLNVVTHASLLAYSGEGALGASDGISLWNNVEGWVVAQNEVSNFWHTQVKICVNNPAFKADEATESAKNNILEHNLAHAGNINYAHGLEINSDGDPAEAALLYGNIARYNEIYNTWVNTKHEGRSTLFYGNLITGVYGSPRYPTTNNGWAGDGVAINGYGASGGVFAYNTIVDAAGAALALTSNGSPINGLVVANNIFSDSGNRRISGGVIMRSAVRDQNTFPSVMDLDNNFLYSPHKTDVYEYKSTVSPYPMVWGPVSQMVANSSHWTNNLGSTLTVNPLFTNYGAADYTLKATSPARNAAKDITALLPDTFGWTDMGAWQR